MRAGKAPSHRRIYRSSTLPRSRRPVYDWTVLYGRSVEQKLIGDLLEGARHGRSGSLVFSGAAGIGKSALLACAAEQASDSRLLQMRGVQAETAIPFAGLHALLRPVRDSLPSLSAPSAGRSALLSVSRRGNRQAGSWSAPGCWNCWPRCRRAVRRVPGRRCAVGGSPIAGGLDLRGPAYARRPPRVDPDSPHGDGVAAEPGRTAAERRATGECRTAGRRGGRPATR